jgi:hypothetical protein
VCDGVGENHLGKTLMAIRDELRPARPKHVLVCGGRAWGVRLYNEFSDVDAAERERDRIRAEAERDAVHSALDRVLRKYPDLVVIEGGAKGADTIAREWARERGLHVQEYLAEWAKYGKRAGFLRNERMLREGKPDAVIAFPGGSGTAMMCEIARAAGVPVWEPLAPVLR